MREWAYDRFRPIADIQGFVVLESLLYGRRRILSDFLIKLEGGIEPPTREFSADCVIYFLTKTIG
jgi:hypothetical protein